MDEKITANLIIEILGRPPEHVKEALNTIVLKMNSEKGIKVINKIYHDPKKIEDAKDLFTAFAEVEVEFETLSHFFGGLFTYMPSHAEIIHPEKLMISNAYLSELGSNLVQKLHEYDAIAKRLVVERNVALDKLKEVAPHLVQEAQLPKPLSSPQKSEDSKTKKKSPKKKEAKKKT